MSIDVSVDDDSIAIVTINRPERLNAMDAEHYRGALAGLDPRARRHRYSRRDHHRRGREIVHGRRGPQDRSSTKAAGIGETLADAEGSASQSRPGSVEADHRGGERHLPRRRHDAAFATDIRIAVPHATFNLAEVKRGLVPGNGGTQRVLSQLPYAIGMELLLTADTIDAETAARWGLDQPHCPARRPDGDRNGLCAHASLRTRRLPSRPPRSWRCAAATWTSIRACGWSRSRTGFCGPPKISAKARRHSPRSASRISLGPRTWCAIA